MNKSYHYKRQFWIFILGIFFCGGGTYLFYQDATSNYRGLIINYIIKLGPNGATNFYWIMDILFAIFTLFMVLALIYDLISKPHTKLYVVVTNDSISISKSYKENMVDIEFSAIRNLSLHKIGSQEFLYIDHINGRAIIDKSNMPSKADFEEVVQYLAAKV